MSNDSKELLLEDYRYIAESMWRNEQGGESRVNLFMSLTTISVSVMAAILARNNDEPDDVTLRIAALAGLFSLLLLGCLTLNRMVTRNNSTDKAKHKLDLIRQEFKDHFDDG